MIRWTLLLVYLAAQAWAWGDEAFTAKAQTLLQQGKIAEAKALAQSVHDQNPRDADALIILGTAVLYQDLALRPDETIYHPVVDQTLPWEQALPPAKAVDVAAWWKQVPALDPSRAYLWEDLSTLFFDAGNMKQALEYSRLALQAADASEATLKRGAYLSGLAQDWTTMVATLSRIPGNRDALLYKALEAWRTGGSNWKVQMKAFLDSKGAGTTGNALAAYMLSDKLRDNDAGFQDLLKVEPGFHNLLIKQKYSDRYSDQFTLKLDLARSLCLYGNYDRALELYADLERRQSAKTPDEKLALAFHEAWAYEASGRFPDATNAWEQLVNAKDFYIRSAACWFLGRDAEEAGQPAAAQTWWALVADEPARSKYAYWADQKLKKLR